jgi:hypothetical protein
MYYKLDTSYHDSEYEECDLCNHKQISKCRDNIVPRFLKARIVKPVETAAAREQLCKYTHY